MSSLPNSDKSLMLTAFNNQLFEFIDDVESVFYEDASIKKVKSALQLIKKMNPSMIIKIWYKYIALPYDVQIQNNNINFFIEKDYKNDLQYVNKADDITKHIDVLRDPVRNMGKDNQDKSFKYIQNLCLLSKLYSD
jgi:hypothetical protein